MTENQQLYLDWLSALVHVFQKIHQHGLMAIDLPTDPTEHALFADLDGHRYREFAVDLLRMMMNGHLDALDMQIYAKAVLARCSCAQLDPDLMELIWLSIWASLKGYAPYTAVEFGRQAMPLHIKISHAELMQTIALDASNNRGQTDNMSLIEIQVHEFITSIK